MASYNSITMGAVTQFKYDITSANLPLIYHCTPKVPALLNPILIFIKEVT